MSTQAQIAEPAIETGVSPDLDWGAFPFDSKIPDGPIETKWERHRFDMRLVNPANKRRYTIIMVGSGLGGGAAACSLGGHGLCPVLAELERRAVLARLRPGAPGAVHAMLLVQHAQRGRSGHDGLFAGELPHGADDGRHAACGLGAGVVPRLRIGRGGHRTPAPKRT